MFDSVIVPCPKCGKVHLFQSKSGDCLLRKYELAHAPLNILTDVLIEVNHRPTPYVCDCGAFIAIRIDLTASIVEVTNDF